VTSTMMAWSRFRLPASTFSPAALSSGSDSPVSQACDTLVLPSRMRPSAAMASPGGTRMRSPGASASAATSSWPAATVRPRRRCARRLPWRAAASICAAVRASARSCHQRTASSSAMNIVTESK